MAPVRSRADASRPGGGTAAGGQGAVSPECDRPEPSRSPVAGDRGLRDRWAPCRDRLAGIRQRACKGAPPLPTDETTFRWVDWVDAKAFFWNACFPLYQEKHANITVQYAPLPWNEIQQAVPLGAQNGNAHGVFQVPLNIPAAQAVAEGWVAPLDDAIPSFATWKGAFPAGAFIEGVTDFNGRIYTLPLTPNRRHGSLVLDNRRHMDEAVYDPSRQPFTRDPLRATAHELTEQGQGRYYGLIFEGNQTNRWSNFTRSLGRTAGVPGGAINADNHFDWRIGQFTFTTDAFIAAIELLFAPRDDGSIVPGSLSLNAPQTRAQMPQGTAGMILRGPWNIAQWRRQIPDFAFDVAAPRCPRAALRPSTTSGSGGQPALGLRRRPAKVGGDIFSQVGSLTGQQAWVSPVGIADMCRSSPTRGRRRARPSRPSRPSTSLPTTSDSHRIRASGTRRRTKACSSCTR
jgi:multiple sugar transport system substrate-binding protein